MCGCSKKSFSAVTKSNGAVPQAAPFMGGQLSMGNLCNQDNMVKIRYGGPTGNHLVGSPLRKVGTYGMHTNGDVFCVHVDDQRTAPGVFILLDEEPAPELAPVVTVENAGDEEQPAGKRRGRPRKETADE